jgi:hypothetical protein
LLLSLGQKGFAHPRSGEVPAAVAALCTVGIFEGAVRTGDHLEPSANRFKACFNTEGAEDTEKKKEKLLHRRRTTSNSQIVVITTSESQKECCSDHTKNAGSKITSGRKIIHILLFGSTAGLFAGKYEDSIREEGKSQPQSQRCAPSGFSRAQCGQVIMLDGYSPSQRLVMGW